jgi:transcriptional regulator with XRE-family HTH domain
MSPAQQPPEAPQVLDDAYAAERARLLLAFGEKLRAERERRNISQETLAEIANVHRTHLGALELGRREPCLAMLLILADALGASPGTMLEGLFVPRERKAPTHSKGGRAA